LTKTNSPLQQSRAATFGQICKQPLAQRQTRMV
jgi:hypothetical protein